VVKPIAVCRPSTSLQRLIRLDRVNRRDRFSMKKPLRSSARGASFHTKHASNVNAITDRSLSQRVLLVLLSSFTTSMEESKECYLFFYGTEKRTKIRKTILPNKNSTSLFPPWMSYKATKGLIALTPEMDCD
jgi:hypothetical protein